ncbi:IPT/TIG domain-containing protein [Stenotrophomonas rhizophila]
MATAVATMLLFCLPLPTVASQYAYDQNGQLIAISSDAGISAHYVYDSLGNLKAIEKLGAGDLAIFSFAPTRGVAGTKVQLKGHGFDPDASANVVRFAGVAAIVESATGTALLVSVPFGAATGPITVEAKGRVATSAGTFIVEGQAQGPAPVIAAVSPLVAAAGGTLHVTGEHFLPVPGQTTARLGSRSGLTSNINSTSLDLKIPAGSGSGRVTVTTAYGSATSAEAVLVTPSGVDATTFAQIVRLQADGAPAALGVQSAGQRVAVLFDRQAGDFMDAQFAAITAASVAFTLYDPANRGVQTGTIRPGDPTIFLQRASSSGTYMLLLRPEQAPSTLSLRIELTPRLEVDGAVEDLVTVEAGQRRRYQFAAALDQRIGIGISGIQSSNGGSGTARLTRGDGTAVATTTCYISSNGCQFNLRAPARGDYLVSLEAGSSATLQAQLTASSEVTAVLARSIPFPLQLARRGQNAGLAFEAVAGETLALQIGNQATQPAGRTVSYQVYRPDGVLLVSGDVRQYGTIMLTSLPASGLFRLFVDPDQGASMQSRVALLVPGSSEDDLPVDAGAVSSTNGSPGAEVYLSYMLTDAPANLGFALRDLQLSSGSAVDIRFLRPNGTVLASMNCYLSDGGCQANLRAVDAGRYSIIVSPRDANQLMTFKVAITRDLELDLVRDTALHLNVIDIGRNVRMRFHAQAGDTLALLLAQQQTSPAGRAVTYRVMRPDGTVLSSEYQRDASAMPLMGLAQTGEYVVLVDANYGETFKTTVALGTGTQPQLELDGQSAVVEALAPGLPALSSVDMPSGVTDVGVGLTEVSGAGGSYLRLSVLRTNGAEAVNTTCWATDTTCDTKFRATQAGRHAVLLRPTSITNLVRTRLTVSSDVKAVLPRDTTIPLQLQRAGQNARVSFSMQPGDALALAIMQQTTLPAGRHISYSVYRPDGSLHAVGSTSTREVLILPTATVGGEYLILVDPPTGVTLQVQLRLMESVAAGLEVDGPPVLFSTTSPGEPLYVLFDVLAGQTIGIGAADLQYTGGSEATLYLYQPGGAYIKLDGCNASMKGCRLRMTAGQAGRYRLLMRPAANGQTMNFNLTVSQDQPGELVRGGHAAVEITRRGQSAALSFQAMASETVTLRLAQMNTTPAGGMVWLTVLRPDGTQLADRLQSGVANLELKDLTQSGTYRLVVTPHLGEMLNARIEYP